MTKRFDPRTEAFINGSWVDISADVSHSDPIEISRGRQDEGVRADPGSCSLTLLNTEGKYSPRNPRSPYYGLIGQNTPLRVREVQTLSAVREVASDTFDNRTVLGSWGTGESGFKWIGGNVVEPEELSVDLGYGSVVISPAAVSAARREQFTDHILYDSEVLLQLGPQQISSVGYVSGGAILHRCGSFRMYQVLLTFDPDSGVSMQVRGYDGTSASTLIAAANTSLTYTSTSYFWLRARVEAGRIRGRVWADGSVEPSTWRVDVQAPLIHASGGAVGVSTSAESTNTNVNAAVRYGEFRAYELDADVLTTTEVTRWPAKWTLAGKPSVRTPITGNGVLHRLGQGKKPVRSSMYRFLSTHPDVISYWPCEDDSDSGSVASALNDHPSMGMTGSADFASFSELSASAPLPLMKTASFTAPVATYVDSGNGVTIHVLTSIPAATATEQRIFSVDTTGSLDRWDASVTPAGDVYVHGYSGGVLTVNNQLASTNVVGKGPISFRLELHQAGADTEWFRWAVLGDSALSFGSGGTVAGATIGRITRLTVAPDRDLGDIPVGHVFVANNASAFTDTMSVITGWNNELAGDRLQRLCRDYGVPLGGIRFNETESMGPIPVAPLLDILDECAQTDGGILYESTRTRGLEFRPRVTLYNQPAAAELDYSAGHVSNPFDPVTDDQHVRNDVTAKRVNGSQYRVEVTEGPLSVADPPGGAGRYDEQVELNLSSDARLPQFAGWLSHMGTWDEDRYPVVTVSLTRNPSLAGSVPYLYSGQKLRIVGLPEWMPPGPLEQIFWGCTQTIDTQDWVVEVNLTPAGPWNVFVLEDPVYGRLDTSGSEIILPVGTTDTTFLVATDSGKALWTTDPADMPFDIEPGGERMTVTGISGGTSPQTFTVVRSGNGIVKSHPAGTRFRLSGPVGL